MTYRNAAPRNDGVFLSVHGAILALDPESGAVRWRQPCDVTAPVHLFAFDHGLYAVNGAVLAALDPDSGATRWSLRLPIEGVAQEVQLIARGADLLVWTQRILCSVERTRGTLRWHHRASCFAAQPG